MLLENLKRVFKKPDKEREEELHRQAAPLIDAAETGTTPTPAQKKENVLSIIK